MNSQISILYIIACIITITSSQYPKRCGSNPVSGQVCRNVGSPSVSIDDALNRAMLDKHNELRDDLALNGLTDSTPAQPAATYMHQLHHDDGLAALAQNYLNQQTVCKIGNNPATDIIHNPNRVSEFVSTYGASASFEYREGTLRIGENIAQFGDSRVTLVPSTHGAERAELGWWNEYKDDGYNYDTKGCSGVCGHYTQMAWAKTRYVGCGSIICDNNGLETLIVLCNYFPGGNFNNEHPYPKTDSTSTPCSECATKASDRDACDGTSSGLCDGCQSAYGGVCLTDTFPDNCPGWSSFCPTSPTTCQNAGTSPDTGIHAANYDGYSNGWLCEDCAEACGTCTASQIAQPGTCSGDGLAYQAPSPGLVQDESQSKGFTFDDEEDTVIVTKNADWAIAGMFMIFGVCCIVLGIGYYLHRKKVTNLKMELNAHKSINTTDIQNNIRPDDGLETPIMDINVTGNEFAVGEAMEVEATLNETA